MTAIKPHVTDFYMDGYNTVTFCKVCSAEGLGLVENCQGYTPLPCVVDGLPLSECKRLSVGNIIVAAGKILLTVSCKDTKYSLLKKGILPNHKRKFYNV